jgi:hypothetical protein
MCRPGAGEPSAEIPDRGPPPRSLAGPDVPVGGYSSAPRWPLSGRPRTAPGCSWSEGLDLGVQEAEFIAFRVGQNVPAFGAALADVGGSGAESEQPLQFGVLVAVGGVDVDVQPELLGPPVGAGAEDEGRLQAAEAGLRGPDLDASVVFAAEFDVAEDLAPERGEPAGIGGGDDELTDATCHARQCRQVLTAYPR